MSWKLFPRKAARSATRSASNKLARFRSFFAKQYKLRKALLWTSSLILGAGLLFLFVDFLYPFHPSVKYSPVVYDRYGQVLKAYLSPDDKWRLFGALDEYDPRFTKALLYKEDKWFLWHPGVNPIAVVRATFQNIFSGKRVSGASTVTMQVVRLLEPAPRTYGNKFREMFRALQLESHHNKDEILELYLNLLPYGGNIEGLKTAAWMYAGASPRSLSLGQIAALAVVPNRPSSLRLGRFPERLQASRDQWLQAMLSEQLYPKQALLSATEEPVSFQRRSLPKFAPHFCRYIIQNHPAGFEFKTNIDLSLQQRIEDILQRHVRKQRLRGIPQASAMIIENKTGAVRCWVGSADFNEERYKGQVDGVTAHRSPGSALKPFLYALAFDKGIVIPATKIADVPIDIKGYVPENYDQTFGGWITIQDALSQSLNIPAVRLMNEMGVDSLKRLLRAGGCSTINDPDRELGLSLVLGGCEVTLLELTALYAGIAQGGKTVKPRILQGDSSKPMSSQMMSAGAAWLTTEILSNIRRPDLPSDWQSTYNLPRIAWKTGTSYGRRDAWSIGFSSEYTIGVWCGDFEGQGHPLLSGAEVATPLLFDLFGLLPMPKREWKQPADVGQIQVCSHSGKLPTDFCTHHISAFYLKNKALTERCTHREAIWVSSDGKLSYCTSCLPANNFTQKYFDRWSPEMVDYFRLKEIPYEEPPPHAPHCPRSAAGGGLEIVSPTNAAEIFVQDAGRVRLTLSARTNNRKTRLHWFVNGSYLRHAPPEEPLLYEADTGRFAIVCRDDQGHVDKIKIHVRKF